MAVHYAETAKLQMVSNAVICRFWVFVQNLDYIHDDVDLDYGDC